VQAWHVFYSFAAGAERNPSRFGAYKPHEQRIDTRLLGSPCRGTIDRRDLAERLGENLHLPGVVV
jgi:hypothetical protein